MSVRSLLALSVLLGACQADVAVVDPSHPDGMGIIIHAIAEDTSLVGRLGWDSGVPGALVHLRALEAPPTRSFRTDSLGKLTVPGLLDGAYWLWAERELDGLEREHTRNQVRVLGGGALAALSWGFPRLVSLRADHPGSLVISEYYYHYPTDWYGGDYWYQGYIELYNNADTTVYLDGKIVGSGFNYNIDAALWPCAETSAMRIADGGVYAQFLHQFPGSGRDYPLGPHRTVLIADQALDHSAIYSELPDLSGADFEFGFSDRADNPRVPNLVEVGLKPITGNRKSFRFFNLEDVAFVAMPLNVPALPRRQSKYQGEFALVPASDILDIAAFVNEYELSPNLARICTEGSVHPSLDALAAWTPGEPRTRTHLLSAQRKRISAADLLQRTRASRVDFEIAPRSPGWIR